MGEESVFIWPYLSRQFVRHLTDSHLVVFHDVRRVRRGKTLGGHALMGPVIK